jgi:hypothetical protein
MKPRVVVIFAIFVLAVVAGAVWFLQSQGPVTTPVENATPAPATPQPAVADNGVVPSTPQPRGTTTAVARNTKPNPAEPPRPLTDWERKIDEVLNSGNGETETAQLLINLLPTMPPEGQAEAAQHISNLILDKDYGRIMPMLKNPSLATEVHDVLVSDLMNREDQVKLPALLEIAKIPNHPYHDEAMTDLQIFLDQDNGNNWSKWDGAVREYLRKQAAEEAAANAPEPTPAIGK